MASNASLRKPEILILLLLCLLLTAPLSGCGETASSSVSLSTARGVKLNDLMGLCEGVDKEHVHKLLGGAGTHQFTARLADGDYECVSYAFEKPFIHYYFIFKGTCLHRIVEPPMFEVEEKPYLGVIREVKKPVQPEKRLRDALAAKPLFAEQFVADLEDKLSKLSGRKHSLNVLPAFLFASKDFAQAEGKIEAAYRRNKELAEMYDPAKVKLGDQEDILLARYGAPQSLSEAEINGKNIRTYRFGSNEALRVNPAHRFSGVAVVVENGTVVRIFSHDFYE